MFLSDEWWIWLWENYSMSIIGFPVAVGFVLKFIAIFNPRVPTDKIIELLRVYWPNRKAQ